MSVPGDADRSIPTLVGAGGRSSVVDHSKTILCLQKIRNVQSPLLSSRVQSAALPRGNTQCVIMLICQAIMPDLLQPEQSPFEVNGNQSVDGTLLMIKVKVGTWT